MKGTFKWEKLTSCLVGRKTCLTIMPRPGDRTRDLLLSIDSAWLERPIFSNHPIVEAVLISLLLTCIWFVSYIDDLMSIVSLVKAALIEVRPLTFLFNLYFYICSILFLRGCWYHATRQKLYIRSTNIKIQHKYMTKTL